MFDGLMDRLHTINRRLRKIESIINDDTPVKAPDRWQAGVDLGTADLMVVVVDQRGEPVAAFMEWAEVVRDGVALNYWGAVQIVKRLIARAEQKLNVKIHQAVTSFPPGTDPQIARNVLEAAGLEVKAIIDEPSSVVHLLGIEDGAVVDIGGGTTGIAVSRGGRVVYSADEPTGGHHVSLTLAGNRKISLKEAEELKRGPQAERFAPVVLPVFEKMAEIIRRHLDGRDARRVYLSGGTFCFPGSEQIFARELPNREIIKPANPLYLTPLAIAAYGLTEIEYE